MKDYTSDDLTVRQGDSIPLTVYVTQGCPAEPRSVAGGTALMTARSSYGGAVVFTQAATIADAPNGKLSILVPASKTQVAGVLVYDIDYTEGDTHATLQSGRLTILEDASA